MDAAKRTHNYQSRHHHFAPPVVCSSVGSQLASVAALNSAAMTVNDCRRDQTSRPTSVGRSTAITAADAAVAVALMMYDGVPVSPTPAAIADAPPASLSPTFSVAFFIELFPFHHRLCSHETPTFWDALKTPATPPLD